MSKNITYIHNPEDFIADYYHLQKSKTKYVMLGCDDEFYIPQLKNA